VCGKSRDKQDNIVMLVKHLLTRLTPLTLVQDSEATKKAFRNGVFWSGDLAVRHPDGAVEIKDRSKDIVISGGENISSIEIESVILHLEDVLEV
jgi:acyl-coenzyme A synthetase/AMP-(fatty) acid ligase